MTKLGKSATPALLLLICLALVAADVPTAKQKAAIPAATFGVSVQPFLAKRCYGCHNAKLSSGTLNLESFKTAGSIAQDRDRWERILQKVESGEMPPKGAPRPSERETKTAVGWVNREFERLDQRATPDPGRVTARRLNRSEYNHTVHDLLGVDFRPADDFPQDDSGYGFDNNGDVLSLSIVQMEKYIRAAEEVARTAVYGPQSTKPTMARYQPSGRRRPGDPDNLFFTTHPYYSVSSYDESGLNMPNAFHFTHRFPVTAEYEFRVTTDNGMRPPGSEALPVSVWLDGKVVSTLSFDGNLDGASQVFRIKVTEGEHWLAAGFPRQFEGLPIAYGGKNPSARPVPPPRGRGGFALPPNATPEQIAAFEARRAARAARPLAAGVPGTPISNAVTNAEEPVPLYTGPGGVRLARPDNLRIQYVEVGGPHNAEVRPSAASLKKIYVCGHLNGGHDDACIRKILPHLLTRAYRRPATPQEIARIGALADRARDRGESFEAQVVLAIQGMLVSPKFLFRIESDPAPRRAAASGIAGAQLLNASTATPAPASSAYSLNDFELASRLSYFLWSSMPDDELLRLAEQGRLSKPAVLAAQTKRMLSDPKVSRFVQNFAGQWLTIRVLEKHVPDFYKFPQYDNYLRMSMVKETEMFFENLIREDRSVLEFLDADYTFVNEYLAKHYQLPGVIGAEFRKVSLAETPRRGLLGQASVLTATSYANRTSVVLRGKWILENLLNAPPPPPPADVPDLEEAKVASNATLRERMEAHRTNAVCAGCHSRMDPMGFGLENFDAIGNYRTKEGQAPVNASGVLPDGRAFNGPVELAKVLRSEQGAFARCLTEKMLTYALGRGLEGNDRPAIRRITNRVAANNYRFSSLAQEIVNSAAFRMRRAERVERGEKI